MDKEQKKQAHLDERLRNHIEGKFGQAKRGFSLAKVMAKLPETSMTAIAMTFLVINLSTLAGRGIFSFFVVFWRKNCFCGVFYNLKL
ncbi:transposase [Okeania hirsuta]|uniref:Transposase DDE domain-containing protein n=1 Tax=Okeania hirsuta TaxID=1458930 RepID=A0A3N6RJ59_9CYAN|nr:hypothetical protein D5R40_21410 [Okeania hirsuta]